MAHHAGVITGSRPPNNGFQPTRSATLRARLNNNQSPFTYFSLCLGSVLAIALLYLAGCGSASVPPSPPVGEPTTTVATALEFFSYAEAVARSVDPTARLVGAQMIETDNPAVFMAQHRIEFPDAVGLNPEAANSNQIGYAVILKLMEQTQADQNVGDGYAERCAFYFELSTGLLALVVNADGSITYERTVSASGKGSGELQWSIDTKEASNLLASANANFNAMRGRSQVMIWDLVHSPSGNAYWQGGILRATPRENGDGDPHLDGEAPDYCELADFQVDALTGTILSHGQLHTRTSGKQGAARCDS